MCPLCSRPPRTAQALELEQIADALTPQMRDPERNRRMRAEVRRLWPAGQVNIAVCDACQFGFASPVVQGDDAFYAVLHERTGYPEDRWEFRTAHARFGTSARRVLDVGAGSGHFIQRFTQAERHAVEASAALCEVLNSRQITAHRTLNDAEHGAPFDLITLFHVIQYFQDPVGVLRQCRSMLSERGRVLVSMLDATVAGDSLAALRSPPHPLTRWSPRALEIAATAAGLAIEQREFIPLRVNTLLWTANGRTRRAAEQRPHSVSAKVDAMRPSRLRTALLAGLATARLPVVLVRAHPLLRRSQLLFTLRVG